MLVPQYTQMCRQCGRLPAIPTAVCPSCGTRLSPAWHQHYVPTYPFPFPPLPSQPNFTPLLVEVLLNVFGLYGVGWLLIGKTGVGVPLLIGSLVLWPLVGLCIILTLGLGLLCVAPLAIGLIVCNMLLLQKATRKGC